MAVLRPGRTSSGTSAVTYAPRRTRARGLGTDRRRRLACALTHTNTRTCICLRFGVGNAHDGKAVAARRVATHATAHAPRASSPAASHVGHHGRLSARRRRCAPASEPCTQGARASSRTRCGVQPRARAVKKTVICLHAVSPSPAAAGSGSCVGCGVGLMTIATSTRPSPCVSPHRVRMCCGRFYSHRRDQAITRKKSFTAPNSLSIVPPVVGGPVLDDADRSRLFTVRVLATRRAGAPRTRHTSGLCERRERNTSSVCVCVCV